MKDIASEYHNYQGAITEYEEKILKELISAFSTVYYHEKGSSPILIRGKNKFPTL